MINLIRTIFLCVFPGLPRLVSFLYLLSLGSIKTFRTHLYNQAYSWTHTHTHTVLKVEAVFSRKHQCLPAWCHNPERHSHQFPCFFLYSISVLVLPNNVLRGCFMPPPWITQIICCKVSPLCILPLTYPHQIIIGTHRIDTVQRPERLFSCYWHSAWLTCIQHVSTGQFFVVVTWYCIMTDDKSHSYDTGCFMIAS